MVVIEAGVAEAPPRTALKSRALVVALGALLALGAASMLYGAWLSDDYLIGLRQSLNFVHGRGFSFFADARVQTMTSPLWGIVLVPVLWLFDAFYAPMLLSVLLSLAAIAVLYQRFWGDQAKRLPFVIALAVLVGTKAYIDFSSSGLENPLAHLFAALLFVAYSRFAGAATAARFSRLCVYAALLCLTRYDFFVLVLPILIGGVVALRTPKQWIPGLTTFALCCFPWLAFSLVYFGTVLPNAFFAKLTTAVPGSESLVFGLQYYQATWIHDPTSLVSVVLGIIAVCVGPRRSQWLPVCLGVVLYLAYIIPAGGDFMVGRFISVPILLSAGLLTEGLGALDARHLWKVPVAFTAYAMVIRPDLPLLDNYSSREAMRAAGKSAEILPRINDEKKAYVFDRGLMTGHKRFAGWLASRVALWDEPPGKAPRRAVLINCGGLGWLSFEYGPEAHVYDLCALADPYLSKLPLFRVGEDHVRLPWGPGHFTRAEPVGYSESVATGTNFVRDPVLADVFDAVQSITTGPLFSMQRWRSIFRLASMDLVRSAQAAPTYAGVKYPRGQDTEVAPYEFYSNPFRSQCTPEEDADQIDRMERRQVTLDEVVHSKSVKLTGTPGANFKLTFTSGAAEVGSFEFEMPKACASGLGITEQPIPPPIVSQGFDGLWVAPTRKGNAPVRFGGLILDAANVRGPFAERGKLVFDKRGCELPTHGGEATSNCYVVAHADPARRGHLTYGPYVRLPAGAYLFELEYRSSAGAAAQSGVWDVAARVGADEQVLVRGELAGTENQPRTLQGRFWVPSRRAVPSVEIRVAPASMVEAEIRRLRIYEAAPAP